jgi:hypothetical protein
VLSKMERTVWKQNLLAALESIGEEGSSAAEFLRIHKTHVSFWKVRKNVGAFWTVFRTIHFNSIRYSYQTTVEDVSVLTLLIHEVKHLQQGFVLALSVYGELEAWQLQFRLYHQLTGKPMQPVIAELMSLPLEYDRVVLKKAVTLMQAYAGKGYRADLLPLYPLWREIKYWLTRR